MVDDDVGLVSNFQKYNDVGSPPKKLWNYKNNVFKIWIIKKTTVIFAEKLQI